MKTIKQYLKEGLVKVEYKLAKKYKNENWKKQAKDFEDALYGAFVWKFTDEGFGYWNNICGRGSVEKEDTGAGFQGENRGDGLSGFRG